jgi:crotonobetainyl-CoA:carnitine CoA-transferase CaiB-like acyl-CoA transferase
MTTDTFEGLLVLELANVLAGPSVGQFFAELGAKVIKIENKLTQGDVTRSWKLRSEAPETDTPAYFCAVNWGKRSIALDLTNEQDLQFFYTLATKADIIIASYKPGDAERLKVDFDSLKLLNDRLIYGHITGYGPEDNRAGYDAVIQAESGFMHLNGDSDGPPTKMPVALMDILTAHQLKEGILVALLNRERTGKGSLVQASLLASGISSLANQATNFLVAGIEPQRMGSEHPNIVPYGSVFYTKDQKQVVLAVGDDKQFKRLCSILKELTLADDPAYCSNYNRVQNRVELLERLKALIKDFDREPLLQVLHKQHVPAGAVNSISEVFLLPQAKALLLNEGQGLCGIRQIAFTIDRQGLPDLVPPPKFNSAY